MDAEFSKVALRETKIRTLSLAKQIRPAAVRAKIKKRIGWHTFRHYSTMLIDNGENVNVTQELMRHANSRCM